MNPTTLAQPVPRMVNDVAGPANPPQTLSTSIVNNIPVHAPAQPLSRPLNEDDELDKIMQDVGQQLKQAERLTPKKRFFHFRHKAKPISASTPMAAAQPQPMPATLPAAQPAESLKQASKVSPVSASSPVLPALFTLAVTLVLIAAAIYSYKLS